MFSDEQRASILTEARATVARTRDEPTGNLFSVEDRTSKWRREAKEAEAEREAADIELRLTRVSAELLEQECAELRADLGKLRAEIRQMFEAAMTAVGEALGEREDALKKQLTEEVGSLRADAEVRPSGEVVELPNPLSRRRA